MFTIALEIFAFGVFGQLVAGTIGGIFAIIFAITVLAEMKQARQ
jgi:hypothetical protein